MPCKAALFHGLELQDRQVQRFTQRHIGSRNSYTSYKSVLFAGGQPITHQSVILFGIAFVTVGSRNEFQDTGS